MSKREPKLPIFRFEFIGHKKKEQQNYEPLKYKITQVISAETEDEAIEKLEEKYTIVKDLTVDFL